MTDPGPSLDGLGVKCLQPRYTQWHHTIIYMVTCRVEPQTEPLKRFSVHTFPLFTNVTQKKKKNTLMTVCFFLSWMFVCLKVKRVMKCCLEGCGSPGCKVQFWTQRAFQGDIRVASSENETHICGESLKFRLSLLARYFAFALLLDSLLIIQIL